LRKERFVFNEITADDRGLFGWKIERKHQNGTKIEDIIYTEELIGMLFKYGKQLSEIQAGATIKDCVITIPSYYTPS
jgi:molecular chaperone DnaK (HSP70)